VSGHIGSAVERAVVDDDDVKIFVVGVEDRANGADDDFLFVVSGDEDGDAGVEAGEASLCGVRRRSSRRARNEDEARAHEHVAREEDEHNEVADDVEGGEGEGVGYGADALKEGERRHYFRGGLAHERGDGNELIAMGAEGIDEDGQRQHGWCTNCRRRRA